jgi:hypothetical protein
MHGNDAELEPLTNIVLHSLWPSGSHPARLRGRFRRGELWFVEAPDMGISWTRAVGQPAEDFDTEVANAILTARGLPCLDMVERRGGSREAARCLASYHRSARACH